MVDMLAFRWCHIVVSIFSSSKVWDPWRWLARIQCGIRV